MHIQIELKKRKPGQQGFKLIKGYVKRKPALGEQFVVFTDDKQLYVSETLISEKDDVYKGTVCSYEVCYPN